jgi:thiamine-phosphate pyrophosphorylase
VRVHAIVDDAAPAAVAVDAGATVVQLRLKGASTSEVIERGRDIRRLAAMFVVNDDVDAALALDADAVHLGQEDAGCERALAAGVAVGVSASTPEEAQTAERTGASYIGCGPVWASPSKPDAGVPIGLDRLRQVCAAVSIPVVAIGGVDADNAPLCIAAGAAGVALIRALPDCARVRAAVDRALAQRA